MKKKRVPIFHGVGKEGNNLYIKMKDFRVVINEKQNIVDSKVALVVIKILIFF